jgi:exonuclease III
MASGSIHVGTWNVRGLCDKNRIAIVKNWVRSLGHPVHVLCLQEIKANDFWLQQALCTILPGYHTAVAPPEGTRGGTAIMVHPDFSIRGQGSLNFGQAA